MPPRIAYVEFPADDPGRACRFWSGLLDADLDPREPDEGQGWQTRPESDAPAAVGVHQRGPGPGDTASLPYIEVEDLAAATDRVRSLGGSVIHPGDRWVICRDSEGNPFALAGSTTGPPGS